MSHAVVTREPGEPFRDAEPGTPDPRDTKIGRLTAAVEWMLDVLTEANDGINGHRCAHLAARLGRELDGAK